MLAQDESSRPTATVTGRHAQRVANPSGAPEPRGSGGLNSLGFVRAIVAQGADVNLQLCRGSVGGGRLSTRGATRWLLAQGYRPGSFKPEPPTIEAVLEVLGERVDQSTPPLQD